MLISVVLSFRNEARNLTELVTRLRAAFARIEGARHELVFVNDDSTDDSLEILLNLRKNGGNDIRVINMTRPFGVAECVMAGFAYARGDAVIYMDSDLQDPPELIPEMVETFKKENADVVFTTRLTRAGESRIKLWLTALGYKVLGSVSNVRIPPNSGDFKLLSRRVVNELLKFPEKKPFIRGLVGWVGFKQAQVFYHRDPRFSGNTHFPVLGKKVIYNFLDSALISFSDTPLKIMLALGALVVVASIVFLIWIFIHKMIGWALPGWSAIMATMVFIAGVQITIMGILGLYVNAIFLEVKRRPPYIVKDAIGFDDAKEAKAE